MGLSDRCSLFLGVLALAAHWLTARGLVQRAHGGWTSISQRPLARQATSITRDYHALAIQSTRLDMAVAKSIRSSGSSDIAVDIEDSSPVNGDRRPQPPLIFYPDLEANSQVDVESVDPSSIHPDQLYDMFLQRISEAGSRSLSYLDMDEQGNDESGTSSAPIRRSRRIEMTARSGLTEEPTVLEPNMPVEFFYKKKIAFGNYLGPKPGSSAALLVQMTSGAVVAIDAGQLISCWDLLADEIAPTTAEDWAIVAAEAFEILGNMSPRKSDLQEFWKLVSERNHDISVDSLDLGIYIFQERGIKAWLNPYAGARVAKVMALSASQRYVAALLLHSDDFHFKRKPSIITSSSETDPSGADESAATDQELTLDSLLSSDEQLPAGSILLVEGAYKVLNEGVALFRECDVFAKYYNETIVYTKAQQENEHEQGIMEDSVDSATRPFRAGCITRQLRALELYALSPASSSPPPSVKHILKRLDKPLVPSGARQVLQDLNFKPQSPSQQSNKLKALIGQNARKNALTPWSPAVLDAATKLSSEIESKRAEYKDSFSGRAGKKGPAGRMDYRSSNLENPVICIDSKKASFLDDAFSLSPETGEILIHIADVVSYLRKYDVLEETAKERVSSIFLPTGPLHMLPPQALQSLRLSSTGPNEVITVALSVDPANGRIIGFRIFPALIGPVFAIDIDTADELLDIHKDDADENDEEDESAEEKQVHDE
jgi:RNB domain